MKETFEKGSEKWLLFKDFNQITKEYFIPEDKDEYWTEFIDAITTFNEKYKSDFAIGLSLALLDYLEAKHRESNHYKNNFIDIAISHLKSKKEQK